MKIKYTFEEIQQEALKYTTRKEFKLNARELYNCACKRKLLNKVCSHMQKIHQSWDKNTIIEVSLKCSTRKEFRRNYRTAYDAAIRLGILDEVCSHMEIIRKPTYTLDVLKEEALKYNTRNTFQTQNPSAYQAARRLGVLDEICSHMKLSVNTSKPEQNLIDILKQKFPKLTKLRDRKVKIEGKPHIRGFDVDIYIPELRKGIEFDGFYWHSVEGLKRGREHFSIEELENYHKIKDEWFLSKGIKLLHIKELEWIKDKEQSLIRIFSFLES